jgi:tRNA threonylcarbamoyladenosine biosynthesis protein TsaE
MTARDGKKSEDASIQVTLRGEAETARLGAALARHFAQGDVIALKGDLGSGKTTLSRAILAALGHRGEVPSPTFTLVQIYDLALYRVFHIDAYRLKRASEIWELGFEDALAGGVTLLEWPERVAEVLPEDRLQVELSMGGNPDERRAVLHAFGSWRDRFASLRAELAQ